jgi:hypothetical protein
MQFSKRLFIKIRCSRCCVPVQKFERLLSGSHGATRDEIIIHSLDRDSSRLRQR